jgi:hypothetical protein
MSESIEISQFFHGLLLFKALKTRILQEVTEETEGLRAVSSSIHLKVRGWPMIRL